MKRIHKIMIGSFVLGMIVVLTMLTYQGLIIYDEHGNEKVDLWVMNAIAMGSFMMMVPTVYLAGITLKSIFTSLIVLLLLCNVTYGQKPQIKAKSLKLFAIQIHHKKAPSWGSDTAYATMRLEHRINRMVDPIIIDGYIVRTGNKTSYFDCNGYKIKEYYHISKIELK